MRATCIGLIGAIAVGCSREAKRGVAVGDPESTVVQVPLAVDASPVAEGRSDAETRAPLEEHAFHPASEASAAASPTSESAPPVDHPPDPSNKTRPPPTSTDLQERAAHLLDAITKNDASAADDFFFPKAPFIPLKDVADPGRYFDQLLATYHRDIAALRGEHKDWTGAEFVSFELGTTPTWVAPGKEYNKIGYFRTFGGKLRYRIGEKTKEIAVSTVISWDGRWYVTHLSPIRH